MRIFVAIGVIVFSLSMMSCGHKASEKRAAFIADSLRVADEKYMQAHLAQLSKVNYPLFGPSAIVDSKVIKGDPFKTYLMDTSAKAVTHEYEKINAKVDQAQKDSTTNFGALLTRFRLLKTQRKYLTATYTDDAHLLRYSSQVTFDEKHEEDKDFYFDNDTLIYFRERQTSHIDDEDMMMDDSYFIHNGAVTYAYRDEGTAPQRRDKMELMSFKRFKLQGDLTGHVADKFNGFKSDYEILLTQPLEPLIYPGKQVVQ